ncbi:MAG: 4-hydroxy-tetrahydrodipicolinate reductase [Oscillospiraceae bacterium]|nr:4-hydroxy-tetrahydrodipicolinate reductase [Oscillospiraceae bacterium]
MENAVLEEIRNAQLRAIVCGANGAMGRLLLDRLGEEAVGLVSVDGNNGVPRTFEELGEVDADVVIDFSHHSAAPEVTKYVMKKGCALVMCTTGHTEEEKAQILEAAKHVPVFYSGNMSLGIAVLCRLAKQATQFFPDADIEILEVHHNRKVDAPSGTAKMLYEAVKQARPEAEAVCGRAGEGKREQQQIGIASLRMGNVVGVHEVHIATQTQILTLRHEAQDRGMFADGAVEAARFLTGKKAGLYDMQDLLAEA